MQDYFSQEQEERDFYVSSEAEVDRYDAELGAANRGDTTRCWILSNRDVWYRNPFYSGPVEPHPESYEAAYEGEEELAPRVLDWIPAAAEPDDIDEDLPF